MAKSFYPESWGGNYTNKDYEPMMAGDTPISKPISLAGNHAMTGLSPNFADAVTRRFVKKVGGRLVDREEVIREQQLLSLTMTILFGNAFETPALAAARRGGGCKTTMYAVNLCPADWRFGHAYIFPNGTLNTPTRVNDLISINETTPADWQAEFRVDEEVLLRAIGGFRTKPNGGDALYAVAYLDPDCASCDNSVINSNIVAVGGAGGEEDEVLILRSSNRGVSTTAVTGLPSPAENVGTSVFTDGDVVLIGFADLPVTEYGEATDPATGGTLFSNDGLATTPAVDTNITVPITSVGKFNGQYMAAGGAGLGAAYLAVSDDGVTWTQVVSGVLPNNQAILCLAVDQEAGVFYVGTEGGDLFQGQENGGSIVLVEITSRLPTTPTRITSLRVLGPEHVAVGGASGFYAESLDNGATFSSPAVPGSTTVAAIAGYEHRSVVGTSTFLYNRDVMTQMEYTRTAIQNSVSITGAITGIAGTRDNNPNHLIAVTDAGEIVSITHFSPYNV